MEIQRQILLFFSGLHNGFLNTLGQVITMFGENFLLIAISVFIYWNIRKRDGFVIVMSLLNSLTVMGVAKAIVRFPRPWLVIDNLETVRQNTATGYSFPSGHTTGAASAYSSIAVSFRKRWLSVLCAVMILLVGLSRMYLCVHWPMDVVGGILIGCGVTFILGSLFGKLYDNKELSIRVSVVLGVVFTVAFVIMSVLLINEKIDAVAFEDLCITFATYGGLATGFALERKFSDFIIEPGRWYRKIVRYIIGMAMVVVIMYGIKTIFSAFGIYNMLIRALRYYLIGFWGGIYPLIGKKVGLFD